MNKHSFMFYPEITDPNFNENIYLKKEFRDTEIKDKKAWNTQVKKKDFVLDPHQIFLKNYISPDTPYNGILIFHGTGVGKTCTAISIAEGFKKTLKNMNKKILVLSNLKSNFMNELYNFRKEKDKLNPEDVVQCTGRAYELGEGSMYLTRDQKRKAIEDLKKSYYQFYGYRKFANHILENTNGWDGSEKKINDKIKRFISNEFDDRVIIIDEIQNIKTDVKYDFTKNIQSILESIIKYGKNIKLILMSATPMFDRPDEIIFYINLLLQNDGREKIDKNEIFNVKDGTLKLHGEKRLRELFTGYVSYIRAEKPYIFPFRIYPKTSTVPKIEYTMSGDKIDKLKQINFTKIILCEMNGVQYNTYYSYLEKKIKEGKIKKNNDNNNDIEKDEENKENKNERKNMGLFDLTKISNITYPIIDHNKNNNNISNKIEKVGSFTKFDLDSDNGNSGYYKVTKIIGGKKKIQYKYQSHAIFNKETVNEAPFADEKHLNNYSTKFAKILEVIKKSKGLILIFSRLIEQGTLPLALMLEQNGFMRSCIEGEDQLLDYNANKLKKGGPRRKICYLCGKEALDDDHHNEKSKNYHIFKFAKYILYFSQSKDIVKISKDEALAKFRSNKNKYGEEIKIFIGTSAISEGLDFKNLRQVHILEPWYNLSRHEQIIGRAIRNQSHKELLEEENNVEIYQYAAIMPKNKNILSNRETVDIKNYRIAENKDRIIKNITRIMKESAVDCALFRNSNIIDSNKKERQITSSGEILRVSVGNDPFTPMCDYKENCNYNCNWSPNPRTNYPINTDTYNIRFASNDIEIAKKHIKNMFRNNIVYHLDLIEKYVMTKIQNIDKLFIYSALEQLVNNRNEILYDKFSRKGYIIFKGDYYIFQPFDIDREEIPLLYREQISDVKSEYVELENIKLDYTENLNSNISNKINENKLIEVFIKKYNTIFNLHKEVYKSFGENKLKYYKYAVIGVLFDQLNKNEKIIFVENILKQYLENNKNKNKDKNKNLNINIFIDFLNVNKNLINYYKDIYLDKSKAKDNIFVGFIIHGEYYIIEEISKNINIKTFKYKNINFIECSKDLISKIKYYKNLNKNNKLYNIIYAISELDKNKNIYKFKIVDKSTEENVLTREKKKSKRTIITGRICSTFQIGKLIEIRDKIGMYKITGKRRIEFICEDLEIFFRFKNLIKDDNKIWFEIV